jgi:type IV secretory pathway VirB2 component (pilin)
VIVDLETLAANTCPALSNSVPVDYSGLGTQMSTVVLNQAALDICGNDVSKISQAIDLVRAYSSQINEFITSAVNSQTYLGNTFTTTDSMITGSVSDVNLATPAFAADLANLGQLIDLTNLDNFGSPLALIRQLYSISGAIPPLSVIFAVVGIPTEVISNLTDPDITVTDSVQRLMYRVMTQITGDTLSQILAILGVTTVGIGTMADLLNPLKLFPNSYQSLTAPTANGPRAIYVNATGSVNAALIRQLPPYVTSSLV